MTGLPWNSCVESFHIDSKAKTFGRKNLICYNSSVIEFFLGDYFLGRPVHAALAKK